MKSKFFYLIITPLSFILSCSNQSTLNIKNDKHGKLKATVKLVEVGIKNFPLDSLTSPLIAYSQIFIDKNGHENYTFFNPINNSIYFYDYSTQRFLKKIEFHKSGIDGIKSVIGFYIESLDSIYVVEKAKMDLVLTNDRSKIMKRISLIGNRNIRNTLWVFKYPQYDPQAAKPFLKTPSALLFTGQYMESIPDSSINGFHLVSHIDIQTNRITMSHVYPSSLYGSNYDWDGQWFNEVYADILPDKKHLVFSFPVSHNLYISDINFSGYKLVYGGSDQAGTISSIDDIPNRSSTQAVISDIKKNDEYAAIKYDPYRKVFYRFLRAGIPNASENILRTAKPIIVIIMDNNFKYLGETKIGIWKNWNIANTFVTKEGLNIEYVPDNSDESFSTLKIFTLKQIL